VLLTSSVAHRLAHQAQRQGWNSASWRSAEASVRLLLAGVMGVSGTAKRSAVPTYAGRADRGMTSALPSRPRRVCESVSRETNGEASDGNAP